jgi:hypothetical protein
VQIVWRLAHPSTQRVFCAFLAARSFQSGQMRAELAGGEGVEGAKAGGEFAGVQVALAVEAAGGSLLLHPAPMTCLPIFAISFPFNPFDAQTFS